MRYQAFALLLAAMLAGGCASGLSRPTAGASGSLRMLSVSVLDEDAAVASDSRSVRSAGVTFVSDADEETSRQDAAEPEITELPTQAEELVTPRPSKSFKAKAEDEADIDRFNRTILDVPVDIRPPQGRMPEDLAAEKFAAEPTIDESLPSGEPAHIFCSYAPWTICYRPLYFEDIALERYGRNVGCLQTGLSGARFFTQVAALPYKMTRRPPRSCECSNGFSRPGDCPLPGYGNRRFELDAALVEAAAVTAFVYIIP